MAYGWLGKLPPIRNIGRSRKPSCVVLAEIDDGIRCAHATVTDAPNRLLVTIVGFASSFGVTTDRAVGKRVGVASGGMS